MVCLLFCSYCSVVIASCTKGPCWAGSTLSGVSSELKSLLSCSNDVLFRMRPISRPCKIRICTFPPRVSVPLGSQIITSSVLWLGKSTTERRGKQRGKKEDRRLYETASRAEVLERIACKSRPSSAACRSRVSHPIKQPQPDKVSIWVHLDSSGFDLRGLATVITSWLERWRLATLIPPAMAGGGSDPCRGSTVKISPPKNPSYSWPGKIGAGRGDCTS